MRMTSDDVPPSKAQLEDVATLEFSAVEEALAACTLKTAFESGALPLPPLRASHGSRGKSSRG